MKALDMAEKASAMKLKVKKNTIELKDSMLVNLKKIILNLKNQLRNLD